MSLSVNHEFDSDDYTSNSTDTFSYADSDNENYSTYDDNDFSPDAADGNIIIETGLLSDSCQVTEEPYDMCCDEKMTVDASDQRMRCMLCGLEKPYYEDLHEYPMASCTVTISRPGGTGHFRYKNRLYQISENNYEKYRPRLIYDRLIKRRGLTGQVFDERILADARDICIEVLKKHTFRHNVLGQLLAACLQLACAKRGFFYSHSVYASYIGLVKKRAYPVGEKILREYYPQSGDNNIYNIQNAMSLIKFYFTSLKIDKKYAAFVYVLVQTCIGLKLANSSMLVTKCIGATYTLVMSMQLSISIETIERVTQTKRTTFTKFYNTIMEHKLLLRPIFVKYEIPLSSTPTKL